MGERKGGERMRGGEGRGEEEGKGGEEGKEGEGRGGRRAREEGRRGGGEVLKLCCQGQAVCWTKDSSYSPACCGLLLELPPK